MARAPTPATDDELATLSALELSDLLKRIETAIIERQKASRAELKSQISTLASTAGFTVDELFGTRPAKTARATVVAVKYRNPDNPTETWSGRGRMAKWIVEKLRKRGTKLEDFAV